MGPTRWRSRDPVRGSVAEPDPFAVATGQGEHGEHLVVDPFGRLVAPPRGRGRGLDGVEPLTQPARHHLDHLGERADGRVAAAAGDQLGLDGHRERHGLLVVDDQGRQHGAGGERVPALDPGRGVDRVAELAQPVDVTSQRPGRDLEAFGQQRAGPPPSGLQQGEQAEGSRAGVRHEFESLVIADRKWPRWFVA